MPYVVHLEGNLLERISCNCMEGTNIKKSIYDLTRLPTITNFCYLIEKVIT